MQPLVLFDIDRTLITAGGAGGVAIRRALVKHCGTDEPVNQFIYDGKTDPQIFREMLAQLGKKDVPRAEIDRLLESYLEFLPQELPKAPAQLYPGVLPLLERLEAAGIYYGLLTGNLEKGARIKLGHFGVDSRFRCGAFGSDSENRNDLPPLALKRAAALFHRKFGAARTVVVGDARNDVRCAKTNGMKALAVATGRTEREILISEGADRVLDSLDDTPLVMETILALLTPPAR